MSFKILKNSCCRLNVHKTWIFAYISITDSNNRTEYRQTRFSSFTKDLQEQWTGLPNITVTMSVWNQLARSGFWFLICF